MSNPHKNNNNTHSHHRRDFSYFNDPNYFGFYNQDWNNNYPQKSNWKHQQSQNWDSNPTPTTPYFSNNYPYLNNNTYPNNNSYPYHQSSDESYNNYHESNYRQTHYGEPVNHVNYANNQNYSGSQVKDKWKNFSKNKNRRQYNNIESKNTCDNRNWKMSENNKIAYKKVKILKKTDNSKNGKPKQKQKKNQRQNKKKDYYHKVFHINKKKPIDEIDTEIKSIDDLLQLGQLYQKNDFKRKNYSINLKGIFEMTVPLNYLKNMIGLKDIKSRILEQIIFFSQDIHLQAPTVIPEESPSPKSALDKLFSKYLEKEDTPNTTSEISLEVDNKYDMLHTVIEGPPGVGKTQLGKVLAKIYLSLGIIQSDKFRIATRKDFIGEYLGHTAIKTQKVIDSCMGGVLFIDEAYSLGNGDTKKDSFSKECIDTLNQNLSENKGKFVCIIAGYKESLEQDFFSVNPGLQRRFPFRYSIEKYTPSELIDMFINKVSDIDWSLNDNAQAWLSESKFMEEKIDQFPNFGGDIDSWLLHCKIEHSKRVFGKCYSHHKILTKDDILKGYQRFLENKSNPKNKNESALNMYL